MPAPYAPCFSIDPKVRVCMLLITQAIRNLRNLTNLFGGIVIHDLFGPQTGPGEARLPH